MAHSPIKLNPKHPNYSKTASPLLLTLTIASALYFAPKLNTPLRAEESSRYTMIETENGIIRLDKQTGAMSNCKNTANNWTCQPIINNESHSDNQPGSSSSDSDKDKIAALELENMKLKQRLADLEFHTPNSPGDDGANPDFPNEEKRLKLPSEEEVDEAITYMEKMIRKFGGAMKRLQEEQQKDPHTEL